MHGKFSQQEISKTVDFCLNNAFQSNSATGENNRFVTTLEATMAQNGEKAPATGAVQDPVAPSAAQMEHNVEEKAKVDPEGLTPEELNILNSMRARQMLRVEDQFNIDNFGNDSINGYTPVVRQGSLSLIETTIKFGAEGMSRSGDKVDVADTPLSEQRAPIAAH